MATSTSSPTASPSDPSSGPIPHVVVLGGGFGGLRAAKKLGKAPVRVTLIDKRNFHLFQPLIYQVATASLSPSDIGWPLRSELQDQVNTTVLLEDVRDIDLDRQVVIFEDGQLEWDYLILATGAETNYFENDEWAELAPSLDSIEDALEVRKRVLGAFEELEREDDASRREDLLTFVIVGGGPTGVELAGSLAELSRQTLRRDFRTFNPASARIILVGAADALLPGYPDQLAKAAERSLERLGVEVRTGVRVTGIEPSRVVTNDGDITTRIVIWGAGVKGQDLGSTLGVPLVAGNRVPVQPTLQVEGHPNVYVVGDLAAIDDGKGGYLPGVTQVAMQSGAQAAANIVRTIREEPPKVFRYRDKGRLATIGWNRAVAEIGPFKFSGFLAWIIWAVVHVLNLLGSRSRFTVIWQWLWAYVTRNRGARLIIGEEGRPEPTRRRWRRDHPES